MQQFLFQSSRSINSISTRWTCCGYQVRCKTRSSALWLIRASKSKKPEQQRFLKSFHTQEYSSCCSQFWSCTSTLSMCYFSCPKLSWVLSTVVLCTIFLTIISQTYPSQLFTTPRGTASHTATASIMLLVPCRAVFWFFCYNWRIWLGTVLTMNFTQNLLWDSSH